MKSRIQMLFVKKRNALVTSKNETLSAKQSTMIAVSATTTVAKSPSTTPPSSVENAGSPSSSVKNDRVRKMIVFDIQCSSEG